jgi:archaellum component FlaC
MKNKSLNLKFFITSILFLFLVAVSGQSNVDEVCHKKERGGCPFKLGSFYILDRCTGSSITNPQKTSIGNTLCETFNNVDIIFTQINLGLTKFQNDASTKLKSYLKQTFAGSIDEQALSDYNKAAGFYRDVFDEIIGLIKDEKCGPNQIKNIQHFFNTQIKNLRDIKEIIETSFSIIANNAPPALSRVADISAELTKATQIALNQGKKGYNELKKIETALNTLSSQIEQIKNFDVIDLIKTTTDLTIQLGSFYGKCTMCAGAIVATITSIQKAVAEGSAVAATPETWVMAGGSTWIAPMAVLESFIGTIGSLASPTACGPMVDAVITIDQDINKLKTYYNKINDITENISSGITLVKSASENLDKLLSTATKELKPSIENLKNLTNQLNTNINNLFTGINKSVAPKVQAVTIKVTKQVANNAAHLYECYEEYMSFTERVTNDVITGIADMFEAGTKIVDAAKIMDNMASGANNAFIAARNKIREEYNTVRQSYQNLEKSLCIARNSDGLLDIEKTAECISKNLLKDSPQDYLDYARTLLSKTNKLINDLNSLIENAANAADKGYTGKPSAGTKARAIQKSKEAREKAASAAAKLHKITKDYAQEHKLKQRLKKKQE